MPRKNGQIVDSCVDPAHSCPQIPYAHCQVGFDLVNIQPPLRLLDPALESRISWVHGNLYVVIVSLSRSCSIEAFASSLTTKLPFDDDEFDHIHIRGIARAVPENKVG
jgi:hypothetical protein